MQLYGYYRSGTSHRTRIALNLKGLAYEYSPVNLREGEQTTDSYRALNPQGLVPVLIVEGERLVQSAAIIEYLEERWPQPPLLPSDALARAQVRALAAIIGCDIHPLNNLRVLNALRDTFAADETAVKHWCARWITAGFSALEQRLASDGHRGRYACGDAPSLADVYLVPQVYSARRFEVDLSPFPRIVEIDDACRELEPFRAAEPGNQADAV